jgi:enamine deaminase RidA (YjgF/YER057c/UK114 family)
MTPGPGKDDARVAMRTVLGQLANFDLEIGVTEAGSRTYILDKIAASIEALGGALEDVVRTRIYIRDQSQWEAVSRVHGRYLGHVRPANTLVEVSGLIGGYDVEIEAEAVVGSG